MTISRRDFPLAGTLAPILLRGVSQSLRLQPRAILIGSKPVFLVSGTVDYFRCPHQLWRDHLLRAKRSGLNTIGFCVAWNFS